MKYRSTYQNLSLHIHSALAESSSDIWRKLLFWIQQGKQCSDKVCFNKFRELMTFTDSGHHNKTFSLSAVMKQTRWSSLRNNSFLGKGMRCSTSAFEIGVASLPACVCVEWDGSTEDRHTTGSTAMGIPVWPARALIRAARAGSRNWFRELLNTGSARVSCQVGPMVQVFCFDVALFSFINARENRPAY